MRRSITSIKLVVILLFILCPLYALTAANDSGSDAVYLEKEIAFTLNPDGSWEKEYHQLLKLETYMAVNRTSGETFITYNPQYQELKVLKSETTMKDGRKVQSPANAFNEVLPASAHYFPHYSHLREMVVTHTGLERGAVIDLHYRLTTKPGFMPYFSGKEFITDRFPIQRLAVKVAVPSGMKLNYRLFNSETKPKKDTADNRDIYTFAFENLGAFIEEPLNKTNSQAFIVFSTASDWNVVFPPVEEVGPLPAELVKKVQSLKSSADIAGMDDSYFKAQALVSDEIANCTIGPDLDGFAVRKLQEVFDSNYATEIEKAYLFYHLLKQLNIPAEIVALPYPLSVQTAQDVPTMLQFDGFLIKIKTDGNRTIYLNPLKNGDQLFPYTMADVSVYNLQEKVFNTIKATSDYRNMVNISGKIKINKDNKTSSGELSLVVGGYFYPYRSTLEDAQKSLLSIVKGVLPVSNLEIKKITLLSPEKLTAVVSVEGDLLKALYQQRYMVEKFQFPYVAAEMISLKERKYPLYLDVPFDFLVDLQLELPEDLEVTFISPNVTIRNEMGSYEQQAAVSKPGLIALKMALAIEKPVIVPQGYVGFREILAKYFIKEALVIVKNK
jgi:hypothetical protein